MQKWTLTLALCFCSTLIACSNRPEISEVEQAVKEFWKPCEFLKAGNFQKTNGVDNGKFYDVEFNYELEVIADVPASSLCYVGPTQKTYFLVLVINEFNGPNSTSKNGDVKKGDHLKVSTSIRMQKSEKGWISAE